MAYPKILIQLDSDPQPSTFDAVVAIDAGVEHLLRHGGVEPAKVRDLVYGGIFTRGPQDLKNTAIFVGGSDIAAGEEILNQVRQCFFGPMRVSVMLDSNGANTTAAATVLTAAKHLDLAATTASVLAATGAVGQRVVRLLAQAGANVKVGSRTTERAQAVCDSVAKRVPGARLTPYPTSSSAGLQAALQGAELVVAAGAPGVELLAVADRQACASLRVAIDLSAVAPAGIAGIEVTDKAQSRDGVICYGAIGVGGRKMKIHKAAIAALFSDNTQLLDAEQLYALGQDL